MRPERPHPSMCLFMAGVRRCERHFASWHRGRISLDELKRRLRANYKRTGAYMGPVGWADSVAQEKKR